MEKKPGVFEGKTKSNKIAAIPKQFEGLRKLLRKSQVDIIDSASKIIEDNATLQDDIRQTNQFKTEISADFNKLKKSLITTEHSINGINLEKEDLKVEIQKWKEKYTESDTNKATIQDEYDRLLWDVLFSLETARKRYEGQESLKNIETEMNSTLMTKIQQELENPDNEKSLSRSDRKSGIIKYIGMMDQIITVLTQEIKKGNEVSLKVPELEAQVKELNSKNKEQAANFEAEKEELLQSFQEESDLKTKEIENMNNDYQKQISLIKSQLEEDQENLKSRHQDIQNISSENEILNKNFFNQVELSKDLKNMTIAGVNR